MGTFSNCVDSSHTRGKFIFTGGVASRKQKSILKHTCTPKERTNFTPQTRHFVCSLSLFSALRFHRVITARDGFSTRPLNQMCTHAFGNYIRLHQHPSCVFFHWNEPYLGDSCMIHSSKSLCILYWTSMLPLRSASNKCCNSAFLYSKDTLHGENSSTKKHQTALKHIGLS